MNINTPIKKQKNIQINKKNTISSINNLSSSTNSSQNTKLQKSNYYKPLSPITPNLSIISSTLHSKPSKPYSNIQYNNNTLITYRPKSIPIVKPNINKLPNTISSPITKSFYINTSPITNSSPLINPIYKNKSSTSILLNKKHKLSPPNIPNHHINSTPPINNFISKTNSSKISIDQKNKNIQTNTSIRRPIFHKNISNSYITNLQNYTKSPPNNKSSKTSKNPKLKTFQKLNLSKLFISYNDKKQKINTKQLYLNNIFKSYNNKK